MIWFWAVATVAAGCFAGAMAGGLLGRLVASVNDQRTRKREAAQSFDERIAADQYLATVKAQLDSARAVAEEAVSGFMKGALEEGFGRDQPWAKSLPRFTAKILEKVRAVEHAIQSPSSRNAFDHLNSASNSLDTVLVLDDDLRGVNWALEASEKTGNKVADPWKERLPRAQREAFKKAKKILELVNTASYSATEFASSLTKWEQARSSAERARAAEHAGSSASQKASVDREKARKTAIKRALAGIGAFGVIAGAVGKLSKIQSIDAANLSPGLIQASIYFLVGALAGTLVGTVAGTIAAPLEAYVTREHWLKRFGPALAGGFAAIALTCPTIFTAYPLPHQLLEIIHRLYDSLADLPSRFFS